MERSVGKYLGRLLMYIAVCLIVHIVHAIRSLGHLTMFHASHYKFHIKTGMHVRRSERSQSQSLTFLTDRTKFF